MSFRPVHILVLSLLLVAVIGVLIIHPDPIVVMVLITIIGIYVTLLNLYKAIAGYHNSEYNSE